MLATMTKTIVVCGHGPGISDAVARRFGKEGFAVAIAARSAERLAKSAADLEAAGIKARAFPTDLADPSAVRKLVQDAHTALGPVGVVHWNAYGGGAGDLLTTKPEELRAVFDVSVQGLIASVQEALGDLKETKGSVLVTGGGLCNYAEAVDALAVSWGSMGLAVGKAAQHKAVGLLRARLESEGVYVGEVVVNGMVKGTAFDSGHATLEAADIAQRFWDLHVSRAEHSVPFG